MTFEEWFHKEYEPADLQIKQCAERNEVLHIPATVYLEDLKKAYEAGQKADVHTDNSKVISNLEAQIEKMKCCGNCKKLRGRFDSKTNINILYCSDSDMKQIEVGFQMCCCKWEIKEND